MIRQTLRTGAGPTDLGKAIQGFLRENCLPSDLDTTVAPEAIARLAQILANRLIARLCEAGPPAATVLRHGTVSMEQLVTPAGSRAEFDGMEARWYSRPK
jgi:hypothetical protein